MLYPMHESSAAEDRQRMNPKRILYCEGNVDGTVGGSYYLLYDLVRNIDKTKYYPIVVFYKDNLLVPKLKQAGIETHVLKRPDPFVFKVNNHHGTYSRKLGYLLLRMVQRLINIFKCLLMPSFRLANLLRKKRIDLVNLNNSIKSNHEWMIAAKIAGVKCVTHQMGIPDQFSALSRFLGSHLDGIISLSYDIVNRMKEFGTRLSKCSYDSLRY